jgi:hypothetical protein
LKEKKKKKKKKNDDLCSSDSFVCIGVCQCSRVHVAADAARRRHCGDQHGGGA